MNFRIVSVVLLAAALAACSNSKKPETSAQDTGNTMQQGVTGGSVAPGSAEEFMTVVGDRVFFALNKTDLSPEATATIQAQATWLQKYADKAVTVEGHADERGTREYNIALGERRANSIKDALVADGVAAARIKIVSYGKEKPVCTESTEECWGKNRRGVTVIQ